VPLRIAIRSSAGAAGGQGVTRRSASRWHRAAVSAAGAADGGRDEAFEEGVGDPHAAAPRHAASSIARPFRPIDTASSPGLIAAAF
jgi:hypothetical protein